MTGCSTSLRLPAVLRGLLPVMRRVSRATGRTASTSVLTGSQRAEAAQSASSGQKQAEWRYLRAARAEMSWKP